MQESIQRQAVFSADNRVRVAQLGPGQLQSDELRANSWQVRTQAES